MSQQQVGRERALEAPVLEAVEVRLLAEIAYLGAASPKLFRETEQLFGQLMTLRPRKAFPYIGMASALLNRQRAEEAAQVMAEGVARQQADWGNKAPDGETFDPVEDPAMMAVFFGLSLIAARRIAEGQQVLGKLLESCDHPGAVRIARGLLGHTLDPRS
jgi:hypothetical protein